MSAPAPSSLVPLALAGVAGLALLPIALAALPLQVRWLNRHFALAVLAAVPLLLLYGLVGRDLGMQNLFWYGERHEREAAGASVAALFAVLSLLSLLQAEDPGRLAGACARAAGTWRRPFARLGEPGTPLPRVEDAPAQLRAVLAVVAAPVLLLLLIKPVATAWAARLVPAAERSASPAGWSVPLAAAATFLAVYLVLFVLPVRRWRSWHGWAAVLVPTAAINLLYAFDRTDELITAAMVICLLLGLAALAVSATDGRPLLRLGLVAGAVLLMALTNSKTYKLTYPALRPQDPDGLVRLETSGEEGWHIDDPGTTLLLQDPDVRRLIRLWEQPGSVTVDQDVVQRASCTIDCVLAQYPDNRRALNLRTSCGVWWLDEVKQNHPLPEGLDVNAVRLNALRAANLAIRGGDRNPLTYFYRGQLLNPHFPTTLEPPSPRRSEWARGAADSYAEALRLDPRLVRAESRRAHLLRAEGNPEANQEVEAAARKMVSLARAGLAQDFGPNPYPDPRPGSLRRAPDVEPSGNAPSVSLYGEATAGVASVPAPRSESPPSFVPAPRSESPPSFVPAPRSESPPSFVPAGPPLEAGAAPGPAPEPSVVPPYSQVAPGVVPAHVDAAADGGVPGVMPPAGFALSVDDAGLAPPPIDQELVRLCAAYDDDRAPTGGELFAAYELYMEAVRRAKRGDLQEAFTYFRLALPIQPGAYGYAGKLKTPVGLLNDFEVLNRWRLAWSETKPEGAARPRPRLVVVAVSGGGIVASGWTMRCLTEIEKRIPQFPYQTRIITGASGGMVGAGLYVATLPAPPADGSPRDEETVFLTLREQIDRDSLTPVICRMGLRDLPSIFVPWDQTDDRGRALERAWSGYTDGKLDTTFATLRASEAEGWLPSLIVSPLLVEDGAQMAISNLDLGHLNGINLHLFSTFPRTQETLQLGTALRMNAAFPFVTPAVSLPTIPARRVADAGYVDNYGVRLAAEWLRQHKDWLRQYTSGVALVQIRAYKLELPGQEEGAEADLEAERPGLVLGLTQVARALQWLTSPVEGYSTAKKAGMISLNGNLIKALERDFDGEPMQGERGEQSGRFQTFTFESDVDVPLSWMLIRPDKERLDGVLDTPRFKAELTRLEQFLTTPSEAEGPPLPLPPPPPGAASGG